MCRLASQAERRRGALLKEWKQCTFYLHTKLNIGSIQRGKKAEQKTAGSLHRLRRTRREGRVGVAREGGQYRESGSSLRRARPSRVDGTHDGRHPTDADLLSSSFRCANVGALLSEMNWRVTLVVHKGKQR